MGREGGQRVDWIAHSYRLLPVSGGQEAGFSNAPAPLSHPTHAPRTRPPAALRPPPRAARRQLNPHSAAASRPRRPTVRWRCSGGRGAGRGCGFAGLGGGRGAGGGRPRSGRRRSRRAPALRLSVLCFGTNSSFRLPSFGALQKVCALSAQWCNDVIFCSGNPPSLPPVWTFDQSWWSTDRPTGTFDQDLCWGFTWDACMWMYAKWIVNM